MKNKKLLLCLIPLLLTACTQKTPAPAETTVEETVIEETETVQTASEKRDVNPHQRMTREEIIAEFSKNRAERPEKINAKPEWATRQATVEEIMAEFQKARAEKSEKSNAGQRITRSVDEAADAVLDKISGESKN